MVCFLPFYVYGQTDNKTVSLNEVVVNGAKVVHQVDGETLYPTDAQKNASSNGYGILQKLLLPNIRIDEMAHTITTADNRGDVQLRINGVIVTKAEMMALDPKTISKIRFIDNPGVRYGESTAYVIDIITKRVDRGYALVADLTPTLTALQGNGMVHGKWNMGKSEFSVSYDLSGHKLTGISNTEEAHYTLTDGSIYTIERNDVDMRAKGLAHAAALTYNWADSTTQVFQASLRGSLARTPGNYNMKKILDGTKEYTATNRESNKSWSPVIDLYYFNQITPQQSITANAVGTYIKTKTSNSYDEGAPYHYDVNGKSTSLLSEIIYENRLKPFTLSSGLNYQYKDTRNDYTSDAAALTKMGNSSVYAFSEIKGSLRNLRYSLGLAASYLHYKQDKHRYDYWTFRPKLSLAYNIAPSWQLRYSFEMRDKVSRIAMISDASIRVNSMEWTMGNPNIKPNRVLEHQLRLTYSSNRWNLYVDGFYRQSLKPNMALYTRTADNQFVYTQTNQKEIDVLQVMAYASCWLIPEKVQIMAYGGIFRCFNFGDDYTHCYTAYNGGADITAYLGHFTLRANGETGYRFLEGETKGYNGGVTSLQLSYQIKNWQFGMFWINPFRQTFKAYESEVINRNMHKLTTGYNNYEGNKLVLNASWRISYGKQRQAAEKRINLNDTDTGIIKR